MGTFIHSVDRSSHVCQSPDGVTDLNNNREAAGTTTRTAATPASWKRWQLWQPLKLLMMSAALLPYPLAKGGLRAGATGGLRIGPAANAYSSSFLSSSSSHGTGDEVERVVEKNLSSHDALEFSLAPKLYFSFCLRSSFFFLLQLPPLSMGFFH